MLDVTTEADDTGEELPTIVLGAFDLTLADWEALRATERFAGERMAAQAVE